MLEIHNRAFKEWAVVCEALKAGKQTVLIRKGGIREEDGIFRVDDTEFFLMPTYDHQTTALLREEFRPALSQVMQDGYDPRTVTLDSYAMVDTVTVLEDEGRLRALEPEHVWNEEYTKLRLDYNPYDPLFVLMLRVYKLPSAITLPMMPEYGGCKSWVTLERALSTLGATPALSDREFKQRRAAVLSVLEPARV